MVICRSNPAFEPRDILNESHRFLSPCVGGKNSKSPIFSVSLKQISCCQRNHTRIKDASSCLIGVFNFLFRLLLLLLVRLHFGRCDWLATPMTSPDRTGPTAAVRCSVRSQVTGGGGVGVTTRLCPKLLRPLSVSRSHGLMSARRVGFWLSDKKRRKMNLDAFAEFCA